MSPKRSSEKSKLRMDDYTSDKNGRQKGVLDTRREIDKVIKKARRDGTQSAYWTKKLLEVEEKEPDRWHHSGYKELYVNASKENSESPKGSVVSKKRSTMYSPSAPTSPIISVRASRRASSSPTRRNNRRSVSSEVRRGSSRSRTDKFSSSTRQRSSVSPYRRTKSPPNARSTRSPIRRSRSPIRRDRSPVRRLSPVRRIRTPSRSRKSPLRRAKSPLRSARSPVARAKSPAGSRPLKPDKAERRNRSLDKLSPSVRRKKSPKLPRYKSPDSPSHGKSPVRRRSKNRSRSPMPTKSTKRKIGHKMKYRGSSSSASRVSSSSPYRKKASKQRSNDVLSSSDCSDSNCSMCRFERSSKEKRKTKPEKERPKRLPPPPEPKLKPRAVLPRLPPTSSSRYARSRSFSVPTASSPVNDRRVESKHKKKSKKEKKKAVVKASKAITTSIIHHKKIKVESPSDESESPSPKRITLSDRFGKMAKWNQKKDIESNQRNIRVTAGDHYRVEELDVPLLEPFPEPSPLLLDGSWDDVRVRYTYYKEQGYLEDLSFQDYLKWEEWWYSYQEWLETERLHSLRRRL